MGPPPPPRWKGVSDKFPEVLAFGRGSSGRGVGPSGLRVSDSDPEKPGSDAGGDGAAAAAAASAPPPPHQLAALLAKVLEARGGWEGFSTPAAAPGPQPKMRREDAEAAAAAAADLTPAAFVLDFLSQVAVPAEGEHGMDLLLVAPDDWVEGKPLVKGRLGATPEEADASASAAAGGGDDQAKEEDAADAPAAKLPAAEPDVPAPSSKISVLGGPQSAGRMDPSREREVREWRVAPKGPSKVPTLGDVPAPASPDEEFAPRVLAGQSAGCFHPPRVMYVSNTGSAVQVLGEGADPGADALANLATGEDSPGQITVEAWVAEKTWFRAPSRTPSRSSPTSNGSIFTRRQWTFSAQDLQCTAVDEMHTFQVETWVDKRVLRKDLRMRHCVG